MLEPKEVIKLIVKKALEEGVTDHGQIANILGQVEHECNFKPVKEIGCASQAAKYGYSGGAMFCGRGFIQITHDYNYEKFGKLLNIDLKGNPELALQEENALFIAIIGMRDGLFIPGNKLSKYINNGKNDFYNARRIVNGIEEKQVKSCVEKSNKWLAQVPALVNGADPDPNAVPTSSTGGATSSSGTGAPSTANATGASALGITSVSLGTCSEIFPIEFTLKEALHYVGCFSRKVTNPMSSASNLGYSANGMKINGASHFNIADFNPTVPICDGCLGFPFKKDIRITSPFCQRRISKTSGRTYYHSGTDYGGFQGEEVIAVADGTVVTPLVSGGYNPGLVDIVHEHLGNLLSRSAHIIPSVQPGSKVKQGDVIGKVGPYPSGGPHLHLELRKDKGAGGSAFSEAECKTKFLDPALFCKRS